MDKILVLDFGGQYNQLIARRVRSEHVFAEIRPYNKITPEEIRACGYKGIIFTGGPNSVYEDSSPKVDKGILELGIPVLGICYGHQIIAHTLGGRVAPGLEKGEYGSAELHVKSHPLTEGVPADTVCWMSHRDKVDKVPEGFNIIASTDNCDTAAIANDESRIYGLQFHPEVTHTVYGQKVLRNFIINICGCSQDWLMDDFIETSVEKYRRELQGKKVLLALSGGVDSSVAALILHRAVGSNLYCVFVDHGLLRKDEGDFVEQTLGGKLGVNVIRANVKERFLEKLKGVTEPEQKRKIIGTEFIHVFEDEARKLGRIDALAQGTIYPDVIESGKGDSAVIKSHHNVGGLPKTMDFKTIVEPLRDLFKDEVREVGMKLGLPKELVTRQPFPGPGLAVRIIGEITDEKLELLKSADAVFRHELDKEKESLGLSQYFAVLLDTRSVGVMGDSRTYGYTVALRAVKTDDFMTAEWSRIPFEILEKASNRITNEIKGITRVVYDITSKPPATVEWE